MRISAQTGSWRMQGDDLSCWATGPKLIFLVSAFSMRFLRLCIFLHVAGSHSCHEESGFCSQCGLSSQEVSRRGLGSYCLDLDMARAFVGLSVSLSASHQKRKT